MKYGNLRFSRWLVFPALVCFQALNVFGQVHLNGTSFDAGITLDPCGGGSETVQISGDCVVNSTQANGTVNPPYTFYISGNRILQPGYNALFNGQGGSGAYTSARIENLVITPYSGFNQNLWGPVSLPWLQEDLPNIWTLQGHGYGAGPNYIGFARPGTDPQGPPEVGCGNDLGVSTFNYTNLTSGIQQVKGISGQTQPVTLEPGQFLNMTNISPLGQVSEVTVSQYTGPDDASGNPTLYGTFLGNGMSYVTNSDWIPGFNSPTQQAGGAYASYLSNPSNLAGGIIWDLPTTNGETAQDATIRAGAQAVVDQLINIDRDLHATNLNFAASGGGGGTNIINVSVTNGGSGSSSNVWVENWPTNFGSISNNVAITNSFQGQTNALTLGDLTNYVSETQTGQSNRLAGAMASMVSATNGAAAAGYDSALLSGSSYGYDLAPSSGGGGDSTTISVGAGGSIVNFVFASSSMPSFPGMRTGMAWFITGCVFLFCWRGFQRAMETSLMTPQVHTAGESVLGTNVNFGSALVVAALIVAVICALGVIFVPKLAAYAFAFMPDSPFSAVTGSFAWNFLDAFCPMGMLLSAVGVVIFFRISVGSAAVVTGCVIKFLVGL